MIYLERTFKRYCFFDQFELVLYIDNLIHYTHILTSPALQTVSISKVLRHKRCDLEHVVSAHSGSQQRLMSISKCRICQQKSGAVTNTSGKAFWSLL